MDGGAWKAAVHGVAKNRTRLSDFTFTFHFHALEKQMATHSSVLAWRIPGTEVPGGLPSMESHRVRHNWNDLAAAAVSTREDGWPERQWLFWVKIKHNRVMTWSQLLGLKIIFFLTVLKKKNCLAALGLSCGMQTLGCGMWDIGPWPGVRPGSPVLGMQSLSYWITREILVLRF